MPDTMRVLLTGATGFVGTHLYPELCVAGYDVVGASRDPERARRRFPDRAFVRADALDGASMRAALEGCQAAFYLLHSMADSADYETVEARSAETFRAAAESAGLGRIVYLGGPRPIGTPSRHLLSRLRTGQILRRGPVPTLELQASMIIGGGSQSWRIVRDLAARLPLMVLPRWLETRTQPIAIDDVSAALTHALTVPLTTSQAYALPGPEVLSGREILERTAALMGHAPPMVAVPLLTPRLSSYWIQWVTRAHHRVAAELVAGLTHDLVARDEGFWRLFPEHVRLDFDEAARRALAQDAGDFTRKARVGEFVAHRVVPRPKHASAPKPAS